MSMPERKSLKPIPKFESEDEERELWAIHDSTEHVDWSRARPITFSQPMAKGAAKPRRFEVELPEEAFRHRTWHPQEVAREMRLLWFLEEVRSRRLGFGKAAELSGLPVDQFLLLMGKHQISPFDYDEGELARELGS
jgi:predicted HTH domain antitoxin